MRSHWIKTCEDKATVLAATEQHIIQLLNKTTAINKTAEKLWQHVAEQLWAQSDKSEMN